MTRILIDTSDLRSAARDIRATSGAVVEARAGVSGAIGGAWLGPSGGRFLAHWEQIARSTDREAREVVRVSTGIEQYAAQVDAEQQRANVRRAVGWTLRPMRQAGTTLRSLLANAWKAIVEVFRRIAGLLRELMASIANALRRFAATAIRWAVDALQWLSAAALEGLRGMRSFIGSNWRTAMKFLHGDMFTGRLGAVWSLVKEIPYVGLFASAVMLASDLVVLGIDEWNFISANNFNGRPPTDAEKQDCERLIADVRSAGEIGVVVSLAAGIAYTGFDTVNAAFANGGMGRPHTEDENRRARQLAEHVVDLGKFYPKKVKVGAEAIDAIFGTDVAAFRKPSKWLDGVFDGLFGANSKGSK